jgi:hypothetical protein
MIWGQQNKINKSVKMVVIFYLILILLSGGFVTLIINTTVDLANGTPVDQRASRANTIISTDTTWTTANSPYTFSGNVLIETGATLTIKPGVVMKFGSGNYMQVEGRVIANGLKSNMITFTSSQASPKAGDWEVIRFMYFAENGSSFKYCKIEYAKYGIEVSSPKYPEAIPNFENNIISDCETFGISVILNMYSDNYINSINGTIILNNTFINNTNIALNLESGSLNDVPANYSVLVKNNTMQNNRVGISYSPGGIEKQICENVIINNKWGISHNVGSSGFYKGSSKIFENLIVKNSEYGIKFEIDKDKITMENNTIAYNGIGILLTPSTGKNNNIFNNSHYNIKNEIGKSAGDQDFTNNWWGTTNATAINQSIYDYYNDFNLCKVIYEPFLTSQVNISSIYNRDTDSDGLNDADECLWGTNIDNPDYDHDGVLDGEEINQYKTNPFNPDSDTDLLTDYFEINTQYNHSTIDWNNDGYLDYKTNPNDPDTDNGGVYDSIEVEANSSPLDPTDDHIIDTDMDGLPDREEVLWGTDITDPDTDDDGLLDGEEVKKYYTNPLDPDTDDDFLTDKEETVEGFDGYITNPVDADTDHGGVSDGAEVLFRSPPTNPLDPKDDFIQDDDHDGLFNHLENTTIFSYSSIDWDGLPGFDYITNWQDPDTDDDGLEDGSEVMIYLTNPLHNDTDNDTILDGEEVFSGTDGWITNPLSNDTDRDGLSDWDEINKYNTSPILNDTNGNGIDDYSEIFSSDKDSDGMPNAWETQFGFNPTDARDAELDPEEDKLINLDEYRYNTNPLDNDTDDDGLPDGWEIKYGFDPLNKTTTNDNDGDGVPDLLDPNPHQNIDTDNDGLSDDYEDIISGTNKTNSDTDGDGYDDSTDAYPLDPTRWSDNDSDNDGIPDHLDAFPFDDTQWADTDGDGYGDNTDGNNPDLFPNEPTQWTDLDRDGHGDNSSGFNGDHFPNNPEEWNDTDGDGIGDNSDAFPRDKAASIDSDGDNYPDEWNPDMSRKDSTTGLKLDAYPNNPNKYKKDDDNYIIWIALAISVIVILGIIGAMKLFIIKPRLKRASTLINDNDLFNIIRHKILNGEKLDELDYSPDQIEKLLENKFRSGMISENTYKFIKINVLQDQETETMVHENDNFKYSKK